MRAAHAPRGAVARPAAVVAEPGRGACARFVAIAATALALAAPPAAAGGIDELRAFVGGARSGTASFDQVTVDKAGRPVQKASGSFAFQRPGKFRWQYAKPLDQLIVGDGSNVYIHDRDLNQVIVRPMSQALGASPAALLAGDDALERGFTLVDGGNADGLAWVNATPRSAESGFTSVKIGFRDQLPRSMVLVDAFGNTTTLRFGAIERNVAIPADQFRFVAPAGADVIGAPAR